MPKNKKDEIDFLEEIPIKKIEGQSRPPKPISPIKTNDTATILSIPCDQGFYTTTMERCTKEEFTTWVQGVYPGVEVTPDMFPSIAAKNNAMLSILKYYESLMTPEQRSSIN